MLELEQVEVGSNGRWALGAKRKCFSDCMMGSKLWTVTHSKAVAFPRHPGGMWQSPGTCTSLYLLFHSTEVMTERLDLMMMEVPSNPYDSVTGEPQAFCQGNMVLVKIISGCCPLNTAFLQ